MVFRRVKETAKPLSKIERRVKSITSDYDLFTWTDQAVMEVQRHLDTFRRGAGGVTDLLDAQQGAEALKALVDELVDRLKDL